MKQVKLGDQVSFTLKRAGAAVDLTGKAVGAPGRARSGKVAQAVPARRAHGDHW
jgi:hypothetical protein